jgi:hypothetical protein
MGMTRIMPYRIRSQRLRTRLRPGAVFEAPILDGGEVSLKKPPGEWRTSDGRFPENRKENLNCLLKL